MYNLLKKAKIKNFSQCKWDSNRGYQVTWTDNGDEKGWTSSIGLGCNNAWSGAYFGTLVSSNCYFYTTTGIIAFDAALYDTVQIRLKVIKTGTNPSDTLKLSWITQNDNIWDNAKSKELTVIPDGTWRTYTLTLTDVMKWIGSITSLRIHPITNGNVGDEFYIKGLTIFSDSNWRCEGTCDWKPNYIHPCERIGRGASCSSKLPFSPITVDNNKLIVNIDDYGDLEINLNPNDDPYEIARDIEIMLSSVGIGGYTEATCSWDKISFNITSGSKDADSSVVVKSSILGFDEIVLTQGSNPASGYSPPSSLRLSSADIATLVTDRSDNPLIINPKGYTVDGGRQDWNDVGRSNTLEGNDKTIIDFCYPIKGSGILTKFYVCGDVGLRTAKIKIFRPVFGEKLRFIEEIAFGEKIPGRHYSAQRDVFEIDCNIPVRQGDFLGVYNCSVYTDRSDSNTIDASYLIFDGDISTDIEIGTLSGNGERGLPFYACSNVLADAVYLDIDFGERVSLGKFIIDGDESSIENEFNITGGQGVSVSCGLGGDLLHSHSWVDNGGTSRSVIHNNQAYNIPCLTDGITYAFGGDAAFQTNSSYSTYFYINGDGEWVTEELGRAASTEGFEYDPFWLSIRLMDDPFKKRISKTVIYFKDVQNAKDFQWEYWLGGQQYGNGSTSQWMLVPSYTKVTIDKKEYFPGDMVYLFENPTSCSPKTTTYDPDTGLGGDIYNYQQWISGGRLSYNRMEHKFDPIETGRINLYCSWHLSTKISEIEVYALSYNQGAMAADTNLEVSDYGDDYKTCTPNMISNSVTSFDVAYPPRFLKLRIGPSSIAKINSLRAESVQIDISTESDSISFINAQKEKNNVQQTQITNKTSVSLDLFIDIPKEETSNSEILSCSLMSQEETQSPQKGPIPYYNTVDGKNIVATANMNANCKIYSLKNLATTSKFYIKYLTYEWNPVNISDVPYLTNTTSHQTYPYGGVANTTFLAIDLGKTYSIDSISNYLDGHYVWDIINISYSNTNTTNPYTVSWTGSATSARWIKITYDSWNTSYQEPNKRLVGNLRIYPSISSKQAWDYLTTSNGFGDTNINNVTDPIVMIDMEDQFQISSHKITGWPNYENTYYISNNGDVFTSQNKCSFFNNGCNYQIKVTERPPFDTTSTSWPPRSTWNNATCNSHGTEYNCSKFNYGSIRYSVFKNTNRVQQINSIVATPTYLTNITLPSLSPEKPWEHPKWWTGDVSTDFYSDSPDSTSLKIKDDAVLNIDLGSDSDWFNNDWFTFYAKIDGKIDTNNSYIRIGTSPTNYFEWNLSSMGNISDTWGKLKARFSDAKFTTNDLIFTGSYTAHQGLPNAQFTTNSVKYIGVHIEPIDSSPTLEICSLKFERCGFNDGLFVRNGESIAFPIKGRSLRNGSLFFRLKPQWDTSGWCDSLQSYIVPTLVRLSFGDSTVFSLIYDEEFVLKMCRPYDVRTAHMKPFDFNVNDPIEFKLLWSIDGTGMSDKSNIKLYANGKNIGSLSGLTWDVDSDSGAVLIFGGISSERVGGLYSSSAYSEISNIIMLTECAPEVPKNLLDPNSLIKISIDGNEFLESGNTKLPILIKNVEPNTVVPLWIQGNLPRKINQDSKRTAEIKIEWRRPI